MFQDVPNRPMLSEIPFEASLCKGTKTGQNKEEVDCLLHSVYWVGSPIFGKERGRTHKVEKRKRKRREEHLDGNEIYQGSRQSRCLSGSMA